MKVGFLYLTSTPSLLEIADPDPRILLSKNSAFGFIQDDPPRYLLFLIGKSLLYEFKN